MRVGKWNKQFSLLFYYFLCFFMKSKFEKKGENEKYLIKITKYLFQDMIIGSQKKSFNSPKSNTNKVFLRIQKIVSIKIIWEY